MEKNVNKIPVRARPGHGHRVAGPSSHSCAERVVEGRVRAGLPVPMLIGVPEGLVAAVSREPAGGHHCRHEAL